MIGEFIAEVILKPVPEIVLGRIAYHSGALVLLLLTFWAMPLATPDSLGDRSPGKLPYPLAEPAGLLLVVLRRGSGGGLRHLLFQRGELALLAVGAEDVKQENVARDQHQGQGGHHQIAGDLGRPLDGSWVHHPAGKTGSPGCAMGGP